MSNSYEYFCFERRREIQRQRQRQREREREGGREVNFVLSNVEFV